MGIRTKGSFSPLVLLGLRNSLLWRHLGTALGCAGALYMCYIVTAILNVEQLTATHTTHKDRNSQYLAARNQYLESLLNKTNTDELSCPINIPILEVLQSKDDLLRYIQCSKIFYNRVPKCGSRSLISVFKELGKRYSYHVEDTAKPSTGNNFYRNFTKLKSFVQDFSSLEGPFLYTKHLHYVNFTKFEYGHPVYINVIRDPIQRLISHYYYNMFGSQSKPLPTPRHNLSLDECVTSGGGPCLQNTIIPFFCGHNSRCRARDTWTLQRAKRVVIESYQLVGLTEDLPGFMEVLETLLPQFFFNGTNVYRNNELTLHKLYKTVKKPPVSEKTIAILKDHLALELDFYQFIKHRFYTILSKIQSIKKSRDKELRREQRRQRKFEDFWDKS